MLFCPFCGVPIVIPDQDEGEAVPAQPPEAVGERDPEAPEGGEPFVPLSFDEADGEPVDWRAEIARKKEVQRERRAADQGEDEPPVQLNGRAPRLDSAAPLAGGRASDTLVPPKPADPGDMFMDGVPDAYDDYDALDEALDYDEDAPDDEDEDYAYEDGEDESFFMRHIRGFVGLLLFLVLALTIVIYAVSDSGQTALAHVNLAWRPEVYSRLGYDCYQRELYSQAGTYYERALARDTDNFNYASSAAMAYYTGQNTDKAATMLRKCIALDPNSTEPYVYLLSLYPDAAQRPWDVTQLLRQGYQRTGDERLKSAAIGG